MRRKQWHLIELAFAALAVWIILSVAISCCQAPIESPSIGRTESDSEALAKAETGETIQETTTEEPGAAVMPQTASNPGIRIEDMTREALDHYFPAGTLVVVDQYLGWKEADPGGYQNLILWGMGYARNQPSNQPTLPIDPCMRKACDLAWGAHCIDEYLSAKGSPLAGYGINFEREAWINGVSPTLMVGLTAAETTFATNGSTVKLHNAWCMKGPQPQLGIPASGVWCYWPDWPCAIAGAARFLNHYWPKAQTAYDCRGYCEGNPSAWLMTVETTRLQIEAVMK